jgi:hypothetical protein
MKFILMTTLWSIFALTTRIHACDDFHKKLSDCTPYTCQFRHPLGAMLGNPNLMMKKEIVGFKNGKCLTTEQMPNKGKMSCLFPKKQLQLASNLYNPKRKTKSVDLKQFIKDGICKITGYK